MFGSYRAVNLLGGKYRTLNAVLRHNIQNIWTQLLGRT